MANLLSNLFGGKKSTKKNKTTKAQLFLKLAGEIKDGKSRWVSIREMKGKYKKLVTYNGNTFPREVKALSGHNVETKYNTDNAYREHYHNKAVEWRINDVA